MSDGGTRKTNRFHVRALERLKRVRAAFAQRDWFGISIEVLVVTFGVLIALAGEQLIEAAYWRREVREFRRAVDRDLAFGLAAYRFRLQQGDCVQRRISELERWRSSWREGQPLRLTGPIDRPLTFSMPTSAWGARSSELMLHIPFETRRDYGSLSDTMATNTQHIVDERDVWRSLTAFNDARQLSNDNLMRLSELIWRARSHDQALRINARKAMRLARGLGIEPGFGHDPDAQKIMAAGNRGLCQAILPR